MRNIFGAIAAAVMMLTAQAAAAATFSFDFATTYGTGGSFSGNGIFSTNDGQAIVVDGDDGPVTAFLFTILGAEGTAQLDGNPITVTGINPTSGALNQILSFGGDSQLLETVLTFSGSPTSVFFGLDADSGQYFAGNPNFTAAGTFNVTAVPEPATWGMMLLGFAAVGATLRRRQRAIAHLA